MELRSRIAGLAAFFFAVFTSVVGYCADPPDFSSAIPASIPTGAVTSLASAIIPFCIGIAVFGLVLMMIRKV